MPKDMAESLARKTTAGTAPETTNDETTDHRRARDEQPLEGGLTREELRALVVEMIG